MRRIKVLIAVMLALVWVPAVSCCLIDTSGLINKQDCCSKEHSHSVPASSNCEKPCGALAAGSYFPQQNPPLVVAPTGVELSDCAACLPELNRSIRVSPSFPATAPPELAGHWQFSFRTAAPPRAPSLVS